MKIDRKWWIQAHTLVACFFLPTAVLFLLTGVFLVLDVKTPPKETRFSADFRTVQPNLGEAVSAVQKSLSEKGFPTPTGAASIKTDSKVWQLSWNGTAQSVNVKCDPTGKADFTVQSNTLLRRLEQLHKSKGGVAFKVLSVAWSAGLFIVLATGSLRALQVKALRNLALITMAVGLIALVVLALIS